MRRTVCLVVTFAFANPAFAAAPAAAPSSGGMVSLSLVDALKALRQPQLAGVFSYVAEKDAPSAFADLLARDPAVLKLYLKKLDADLAAAKGMTDWDHGVCASLVITYSSPLAGAFAKPDAKRLSKVNRCVLAPVVTLEEITARRSR